MTLVAAPPAFARKRPLSNSQLRAVAALLGSSSLKRAAHLAGVNERTLRRWLEDTDFKAELQAGQRRALEDAEGLILALSRQAADELRKLAIGPRVEPSTRLRALRLVFEIADRVSVEDMEARLDAIEAALRLRDRA